MREMYFESVLIADIVNKSARFQKFEKGLMSLQVQIITLENHHY
jgi:hypothetical protein